MATAEQKSLRYAAPGWMRRGFRLLELGAPPLAVRLAVWRFCKPRRRNPRPEEVRILAAARRQILRAGRQRLVSHVWGEGPLVILHHGWGGSGAQMSPLANALATAGYRVMVLDARSHGESPGRQATLPQMSEDLREISSRMGEVHALIGHSMGAMICARALQLGAGAHRVVMIAAPAEIMPYARFFQRVFDLRDATVSGMIEFLHDRFGLSPADATAGNLAAGRAEPLLILHDRQDSDVPMRHPEAWMAVWPGARLEVTEGLGHRRILRDAEPSARVIDFLRGA